MNILNEYGYLLSNISWIYKFFHYRPYSRNKLQKYIIVFTKTPKIKGNRIKRIKKYSEKITIRDRNYKTKNDYYRVKIERESPKIFEKCCILNSIMKSWTDDNHKAPEIDNFIAKTFNEIEDLIITPLGYIINNCLEKVSFPKLMM